MEILRQFALTIGPGNKTFVLPSARRLLKHLRARDFAASIAEMVNPLQRLQKHYLVLWEERQQDSRVGEART